MFTRLRRLPSVNSATAGPFHLVCSPFKGEYRNQRSIAALRGDLYQDLLNRHRIIGFDGATLYLDLTDRWTGRGMVCFRLRANPGGVAGANKHLQAHFGAHAISLEDTFQRDWDRLVADNRLTTLVIPEQPVLEARVPSRGDAASRRWSPRILPYLLDKAREQNHQGDTILEVADTIRKEISYLVLRAPDVRR